MSRIVPVAWTNDHPARVIASEELRRGALVFRATTESECYRQASRYFPTSFFSDLLRTGDALAFVNWLRARGAAIGNYTRIIGPAAPSSFGAQARPPS